MHRLIDLLLPPSCAGCGREGTLVCSGCRMPLERRLHDPPGSPLGMPVHMPSGIVQLEWCAMYSGTVRSALHALKYRGERRLAEPLGEALASRWERAGRGGGLVTWAPVHPSRLRERGFDQAEELARAMAVRLGLPLERCLERRQRTRAQHALGQQARADNTAAAFAVPSQARKRVRSAWVIVVDDIVTTGATLAGCAAALASCDAAGVSAIAVARDR